MLIAVCILLAACLLFFLLPRGGDRTAPPPKGELTVGTDIAPGDITEFYYTYSASTDPPVYRRYRFYAEDGKTCFSHEVREGDHWPLREEDISVSGTKELTPEEWGEFLDCVKGGAVKKRAEDPADGSSGPWLYLYWTGDRGEYQEFSFPAYGDRLAFEALCLRLKEG